MALLVDERPRPRRRSRGATVILVVLATVVLVAVLGSLSLPSLNPFAEDTRDRSGPVLLQSLRDLSQYRAASANLQVVVDVERDARLLPDFIKGERVLLLAAGSVDAYVDFAGLGRGRAARAVRVSGDRRAVSLSLPAARLGDVRLNPALTRVVDRDRGLADRVGDAFGDNPTDDQPLYRLASRRLREGAAGDPNLLRTAEANTRAMLEGLLRGLGFTRIAIRFARPQA